MTEGRSDFEILSSGFERAYVGGSYFNPPADVLAHGRRLAPIDSADVPTMNLNADGPATYVTSSLFQTLSSALADGELLFAVYLRGDVLVAPFIWDAERLIDFEQQVPDRVLSRRGFFGVRRDLAEAGLQREAALAP